MAKQNKQLFLIDGNSLIRRSYHAIPIKKNSQGLATNAIQGFTGTMLRLLREKQPDFIGVALDCKGSYFRSDIYPEYKANREPMPADLVVQMNYIKQLLQGMEIPCFEVDLYEADDILATLASRFSDEEGIEVVVVTGDKDMMQIVCETVCLMDPRKHFSRVERKEVLERFGVEPHLVPEVLGLAGDSGDNVPGVPGIGEKTAISLIVEHGSIAGVYTNLEKVSGKKRVENLKEFKEQALLSADLTTVYREVPLPSISLESLKVKTPNSGMLAALFKGLELKKLEEQFKVDEDLSVDCSPADESNVVHIFSDGACSGNPGPGGYGTIMRWNGQEKSLAGFDPDTTNQRMELMGAMAGLELIKRPCKVKLISDSQYLLKGLNEWMPGWVRRGWKNSKGDPVANRDLWEHLLALTQDHQMEYQWVKGHNSHPENERCDAMARAALEEGLRGN